VDGLFTLKLLVKNIWTKKLPKPKTLYLENTILDII